VYVVFASSVWGSPALIKVACLPLSTDCCGGDIVKNCLRHPILTENHYPGGLHIPELKIWLISRPALYVPWINVQDLSDFEEGGDLRWLVESGSGKSLHAVAALRAASVHRPVACGSGSVTL